MKRPAVADMTTPAAQDKFKRWFDAAPIYSGPPLANRLGWQGARTVAKNSAIALRRARRRAAVPREYAEALDADGIVSIPGYLSQERYEHLKRAYEDYTFSHRVRDIGHENGSGIRYLTGPVVSDRPGDSADVVNSILATDPLVVSLGEHVIGRTARPPLRLVLQVLERGEGGADDSDREQLLHADKAYACAKAIYVLDPVTERSSPFVYCPGTHRMTLERLRYEHAMGVREALSRRGRTSEQHRSDGIDVERARHVMGQDWRDRLGIRERAMACPGNTLIVTNNFGFHRRGTLAPGERRRSIWVNFYQYQRPWYGQVAFRMAKSLLDTDNVSRALPDLHQQPGT